VSAYPGLEALSVAAAESIVGIARESVADRGRFSIALAGGNTPKRTYRLLVERHRGEIEWPSWLILFGDERFVPWDDDRSNYKMARDTLLADAPIPNDHVHPVPTRTPTVGDAADAYNQTLRRVLANGAGQPPAIDLVLLGVGPDGHTASLFPGSPALGEQRRWARAVDAPTTVQPAVPRVTLTLPILNAARNVIFLVAGSDKRPVIAEILHGAETARRYPAGMVAGAGRTLWMVEQSAMPSPLPNT
jgi:6-phosphogluconolactonase